MKCKFLSFLFFFFGEGGKLPVLQASNVNESKIH